MNQQQGNNNNPLGFLKGDDAQFNDAMKSVDVMFDDMYKPEQPNYINNDKEKCKPEYMGQEQFKWMDQMYGDIMKPSQEEQKRFQQDQIKIKQQQEMLKKNQLNQQKNKLQEQGYQLNDNNNLLYSGGNSEILVGQPMNFTDQVPQQQQVNVNVQYIQQQQQLDPVKGQNYQYQPQMQQQPQNNQYVKPQQYGQQIQYQQQYQQQQQLQQSNNQIPIQSIPLNDCDISQQNLLLSSGNNNSGEIFNHDYPKQSFNK